MCDKKVDLIVPIFPEDSFEGTFRYDVKPVDQCIAPIVKALNDAGIYTVAACCGHGKGEGSVLLRDGRELIIKKQLNEKLDC